LFFFLKKKNQNNDKVLDLILAKQFLNLIIDDAFHVDLYQNYVSKKKENFLFLKRKRYKNKNKNKNKNKKFKPLFPYILRSTKKLHLHLGYLRELVKEGHSFLGHILFFKINK